MNKLALSIDEFCDAFGVGRTKVYDEINAGRLPIIKVGKRTIITMDGAAEWQRTLEELSADAAVEWRERVKAQTKRK